jgi:hypothetical protein
MALFKKKRLDDEEEDPELDQDEEEDLPEPKRIEKKPKQLTKEEVGALAQYHQSRALELINLYRQLD